MAGDAAFLLEEPAAQFWRRGAVWWDGLQSFQTAAGQQHHQQQQAQQDQHVAVW
jgi:hypothetical protein